MPRQARRDIATIRYVIVNPVRAGLCDDPYAWRWSGSRYGRDAFG